MFLSFLMADKSPGATRLAMRVQMRTSHIAGLTVFCHSPITIRKSRHIDLRQHLNNVVNSLFGYDIGLQVIVFIVAIFRLWALFPSQPMYCILGSFLAFDDLEIKSRLGTGPFLIFLL